MQRLPYIIFLLFILSNIILSQTSPHGEYLEIDCKVCHTTDSWGVKNSKFEHSSTEFELVGQHEDVNCLSCHKTLKFNEVEPDCKSCHTDIHENSVGFDCERCHSPINWLVSDIEDLHRMSRFPLLGPHKIIDCNECHISNSNLNFKPLGAMCSDCHTDNYLATTKPNHTASGYSLNCDDCHSLNAATWAGAGIVHAFFPLTGGHDILDCYQCHQQDTFIGLTQDCVSCHIDNYNNTVNPSHISLGFNTDCQSCHSIGGWRPATFDHDERFFPIYSGEHNGEWDECSDCHTNSNDYGVFSCTRCHGQSEMNSEHSGISGYTYENNACFSCHPTGSTTGSFSHTQTFPLTGSHANITCSDCHTTTYSNISSDCISCHKTSLDNTQNPNHTTLVLSEQCEHCHTPNNWVPSTFSHATTGFELLGSHTSVNCSDCHIDNVVNAVQNCFSCHEEQYNIAPNHSAQNYPKECETCHNSVTWIETTFDHNATNFPLTGAHINSDCNSCHASGYTNISTDCVSCHQNNFDNTTNPSHQTLGLSTDCVVCHTTNPGWSPAEFPEHNSYFELLGAHATIASNCVDCHNSNYNNTPNNCFGCHETNYNNTTNPSHTAAQFPTNCEDCHSVTAWTPATFDHDGRYFPIYSGKHNNQWTNCSDCHTTQNNFAQFSCIDCHEHNQTDTDSEHSGVNGYVYESNACYSCHPTGSEDGSFSHTQTFPLTGSHANLPCSDCHVTTYTNTSTECISCHQSSFDNTQNPNHKTLVLSEQCELCHTATNWVPSTFTHATTGFELLGSHASVNCSDCHVSNVIDAVQDCFSCHEEQYNNAQNHLAQNYPKECETCHNSVTWVETTFDHNTTNFPLTGAHINTDCNSCHTSGFTNVSAECSSCHQSNFDNTVNPSHQTLGLSTDCVVCHTTNAGWSPAEFPNHNNYFELLGAHATIASNCVDCHNSDYNNTPTNCFGCHETNYNNTTNPSHTAAQFPTNCEDCHSVTAWTPATFDHDGRYFPIYSGEHKNEWTNCNDCHTTQNNYALFSCIDCHEHNQTEMNSEHSGVNGYVYESNACYTCHPNGSKVGSFSHTQAFPLIGSHSNIPCSDCHVSTYANTSSECISCHQSSFDNTKNPNHKTLSLSVQCELCHDLTDWFSSTFIHASTGFELLGSHLSVNCIDCHSIDVKNAVQDCYSCHETNYKSAPNHLTQNYPKECEMCHNSVTWGETSFDHNTTNFPLTGAHINSDCSSCHTNGYTNISTTCSSCHQSNFDNTVNPSHQTLGLSTDCVVCHTTNPGWSPAEFPNHNNYFELLGAHRAIANNCVDCHNNDYNNTPSNCFGCHETNYNKTTNPSHTAAQFSTNCEDCHSVTAWIPATFDHDGRFFPIYSGEHNGKWVGCSDCHTTQNSFAQFSCVDCHEHNQVDMNTVHSGINGYVFESNACYTCHPTGSKVGSFSHTQTFPLVGSHANLPCSNCHVTTYTNTSTECISCHQSRFDNSQNPNHKTIVLSNQCELCHTVTNWIPSTFNHKTTGFELLGSHTGAKCSDCHSTSVVNAVQECISCHQSNFDNTQNPNHRTLVLSNQCELCHNSTNWSPSTFEHKTTGFILLGSHATVVCSACHSTNVTNAVQNCFSCHENEYNIAPNHLTQNYPQKCETCHNSVTWIETTFDHNATNFPLTGAHVNSDCNGCHASGYTNVSTICSSCHQSNFDNTTNPSHQTLGLSTDCVVCHTTNAGWSPAEFPNHNNYFELLGAHAAISSNCVDCHNGNYNNTPVDCFGCHSTDYNNTTNPSHSAAQFPTTCNECHSVNAWTPATFDHDGKYFPIYSGKHKNEWTNCTDCHTTINNYSLFSCIDCHEHNQTDTNADHSDVTGYVYESTACFSCHPTGIQSIGIQKYKIKKVH